MNNDKLAKIAVNKSLLKEYSNSSNERIVYMNDDTEFQIQIFNPYSYTIGVTFGFNEDSNLYNNQKLLVLRPCERVWLERYLDNESHLLFSTYEVGASNEVKKAIKDNGNIYIKFFKEQERQYWNNVISTGFPNTWYHNTYNNGIENQTYDQATSVTNTLDELEGYMKYADSTLHAATYASSSITTSDTNSRINFNTSVKKSIETGRIEEGSHSNQKFQNIYKDFEYWPFKTECIKILPLSQKPINTNDLSKRYCHQCGRKLSPKYKFCPFCGAKQ